MIGIKGMEKSTHRVDIVPVVLEKHPNADSLSVVRVYGYTVVVKTDDWKDQELGCYIPPDSVVPDTPAFSFLPNRRIRVVKLRGIISMGLLVPLSYLPEEVRSSVKIGDDVAEILGVTHYEPPVTIKIKTGGQTISNPPGYHPIYNVDSMYRYYHVFTPGELVMATEKIHGANARWTFEDGQMYAGSHRLWLEKNPDNLYWKILEQYPEIEDFCRKNSAYTIYGEIYGMQDLKYDAKDGCKLVVFDILQPNGVFVDGLVARDTYKNLPWVPLVACFIPFDFENLKALAEGQSLIKGANHIREGIVVKPLAERTHEEIGRVQLKLVSNDYLLRNKYGKHN